MPTPMRKIDGHVHWLGPKEWAVSLMDRHGMEKVKRKFFYENAEKLLSGSGKEGS